MAKSKRLPKEIFVYICDKLEDGTPIYCATIDVEDIPEDMNGANVGVYSLNKEYTFNVKRELK